MTRWTLSLVVLFGLAVRPSPGQQPSSVDPEEKGTYLGALFCAVPEARYTQLPNLPQGQGVLITHVLPASPAAAAELQRDDILIQYDAEKIRDCEHLARLIRADKPDRKVKLVYLRDGRELTTEATLKLGPVLQIASTRKAAIKDSADGPPGSARTGGPPAVSVAATPLADGSLKLTIEYYPDGSSRPRTVTCSGSPAEIDREVEKLPVRVQELIRVALHRIRALELQKGTQSNSSAPKPR